MDQHGGRAAKISEIEDALRALGVGVPHNARGVKVDYRKGVIIVKVDTVNGGERLRDKLASLKEPFFEEIAYEKGDNTSTVTIKYAPKPRR